MQGQKRNIDVLHDKSLNKSTAFTREERDALGLRGLLPYAISTQEMQIERIMLNLRRKESDIERYILLSALQSRSENLYYKLVIQHIEEVLPLIYTPTVGQACKEFSHIFRATQGFYITPDDRGRIEEMLGNWPEQDIKVIVVTDGQRILGLGDLGANGMGIPIGKLAIYCACGGIHPRNCLPVVLDVGTNTKSILDDPLYIGYPHERLLGEEYFSLVDEFITAVQNRFPQALIQFEDFQTANAHILLNTYAEKVLCFNDDIQGTAAVALAGVIASGRITGIPFRDLRIMFLGAGSASTGIAGLMVKAFAEEGIDNKEAHGRLWFIDGKGLVVTSRTDLADHKLPFAHDYPNMGLMEAIANIKPHVLIGATGTGGSFSREVIELMSEINPRPVIFALSNPTERAECTALQAYEWSNGNAVFASGSPFKPIEFADRFFTPGQGNNAYIFPGLGLGVLASQAKLIPDDLFLTAAKTLASIVSQDSIDKGSLYPSLKEIRRISVDIAIAVAEKIYAAGLAQNEKPADLRQTIANMMYDPTY